ncbi:MAG: hypothetical protein HOC70_05170 [Gammaproteobacteria bacterium]|jgi:nucleoside phosphorylase|nr:hypothetical protein [Gammaproteobacteria bacterium]
MVGVERLGGILKSDVLILTPTALEYEVVRSRLTNPKKSINPLPTSAGVWAGCNVLCCCSGKGQEETASALSVYLENHQPKIVLLCGIAGGFPDEGVHRGDVVVAHTIHSFDYGKLEEGFKRRPENDYNFDRQLLSIAEVVHTREGWKSRIKEQAPQGKMSALAAHVDCYVASSNKVIDDPENTYYLEAKKLFPEIHAVEMEAIGAAASVRLAQADRTLKLLMVRGISDEVGSAGGSSERRKWKSYATDTAAAFVEEMLIELSESNYFHETQQQNSKSTDSAQIIEPLFEGFEETALSSISRCLKGQGGHGLSTFNRALDVARNASNEASKGREARAVAERIVPEPQRVAADTSKRTRTNKDWVTLGRLQWNSGDYWSGQMLDRSVSGSGVCNVYPISDRDPEAQAAEFCGRMSNASYELGTYRSAGRHYYCEWRQGKPAFGVIAILDRCYGYDYYFGDIGEVRYRGRTLWYPIGYGVAIDLASSGLIVGDFDKGIPSSGVSHYFF